MIPSKVAPKTHLSPNVIRLSCEPPAGVNGRLGEDQDPRAWLVNCSGWLGAFDVENKVYTEPSKTQAMNAEWNQPATTFHSPSED